MLIIGNTEVKSDIFSVYIFQSLLKSKFPTKVKQKHGTYKRVGLEVLLFF